MTNVALVAAVLMSVASLSAAADQTWTGTISDTMCASSHQANIEHARGNSGKQMTDQECTVGCVARRGQKYVFVSNGTIFEIENQDHPGLPTYAARTVTLTGRLSGQSINVTRITAPR